MISKVFRVMASSEEYLTSDVIAMALLQHVTMNPQRPNIVFGVEEIQTQNASQAISDQD